MDEFNVAIVAVNPLRESAKGGWVSLFSGSRGIAEVADTIFCLERQFKSRTATLHRVICGMAEEQLALKFSPHGWLDVGRASELLVDSNNN